LQQKLEHTWENISDDILIQEYILWDEYSVSVVNGEILPIMMLQKENKNDFFDYESKYETESGMKEVFWVESSEVRKKLHEATKLSERVFGVKWYFRADFIVRDGTAYFLEINTIPGSTEASILPKAWKLTGRSLGEFVTVVLK
jgi:D-alanine-D-alanine ligase